METGHRWWPPLYCVCCWAFSFVMFVIAGLFKMSVGLVFGVAVLLVTLMILSRQLKKQSIMIERTFFQNLRYRDMRAEYMGEKKPEYAGASAVTRLAPDRF